MKRIKKSFRVISLMLVCVFCLTFSYFVSRKKVEETKEQKQVEYKILLELWSIDSFEGGKGSRYDFLVKQATRFEKKNKGVIISVVSHTLTSAENCLRQTRPDMISCGNGLNSSVFCAVPIKNGYQNTYYNKNNYGISWCRGGYILIGENSKKLVVSQAEYTLPIFAIKDLQLAFDEIEVLSPYKAYQEFLKGNCSLLGSQRDVFRLENKGIEFSYKILENYSDLFQNIYLTCNDKTRQEYSKKFMSYMLSTTVQQSLTDIGMISTTGQKIYSQGIMAQMEKIKITKTTSVFYSATNLKNMQEKLLEEYKKNN